jgi:hypothetical protein
MNKIIAKVSCTVIGIGLLLHSIYVFTQIQSYEEQLDSNWLTRTTKGWTDEDDKAIQKASFIMWSSAVLGGLSLYSATKFKSKDK